MNGPLIVATAAFLLLPGQGMHAAAQGMPLLWSVSRLYPGRRNSRHGDKRKGVAIVFEERLYAATPQVLLSVIRSQDDTTRTLLVIGHNPGLQETAELLIAAGDVELRERLREKFPTAALSVIDFAVDKWGRVHDRSGRLGRYITPRSVAAATN